MARAVITNAEIDPESPATTGLMTKYRDNDLALFEGHVFVKKPGDESDVTDVLQDDDDLKLTMLANQTWHVEITLFVTTSNINADIELDFTTPAGATWVLTVNTTDTVGVPNQAYYWDDTAGATSVNYGVTNKRPVVMQGWVSTAGNAGDFQLQWARFAGAGTTTVTAGSYLMAQQDPSTM